MNRKCSWETRDVPFDHYFGKDSQCHEPDG
jgi:hypothetical protein